MAPSGIDDRPALPATALAMSQVGRAGADPALLPDGVRALTGFGARVFGRLLSDQANANVVCSPYSIFTALAMARTGAAGATAEAMDAVLGVSDAGLLPGQVNALTQTLAARAGERTRLDRTSATITWHDANSLWGQRDVPWEAPFLDTLASHYGTGMRQVDYRGATESARAAINRWTSDRTKALIPEIIPAGAIDGLTVLVLVNALYLKAPWERTFVASATADAPFTRADGSRVTVPMMRGGHSVTGVRGEGWVAAELPYAGRELAMAVILPDVGAQEATRAALSGDGLAPVLAAVIGSQEAAVVEMPRLKVRTTASLTAVLTALGMGVAFSDKADFSGMTAAEKLLISNVLHEAVVAVDEDGTEAAAATAVLMSRMSLSLTQPLNVVLDRPFFFVIHDVATAAPLFLGYVADPTATAARASG